MLLRRLRLIGGNASGTYIDVDDARCRSGELVQTIIQRELNFESMMEPGPTVSDCLIEHYRVCVIHLPGKREVYYAVPLHWKDDDGLISLFGQPRYV